MIKLLWNTHNQKKSNTQDKKTKDKLGMDYLWGIYHKEHSSTWIYEILKKIEYKNIESATDLEKKDILIIVDSSIEEKGEFYAKLNLICSNFFFIPFRR